MGNPLIIDNWLLQDIGETLTNGLEEGYASELVIEPDADSHSFRPISSGGVQIESLLGVLVDIVLRDSIVVDSDYTNTWSSYETLFAPLLGSGLIRSIPFNVREEDLAAARSFALRKLCITSTLRQEQKRNEESWAATHEAADPYLSTVIWGTAGMLGRSHVFEAPYSGHPLRKRVLEQTILSNSKRDAITETVEWMSSERLRIFEHRESGASKKTATLILPPIAVEILEEAHNIHQLLPVAVQLRDKYAKLREWLNSVQTAMDSEDPKAMAKYKKLLSSVSKDIDRTIGDSDAGQLSLSVSIGGPSISYLLNTLGSINKRFGVRATLSNQIFSAKGEKSLRKLLRMLGEERSSLGLETLDYLRTCGNK